ncbi:MAG: hypothetical protein ABIU05_15265 [Nitrospirales bacterium]
MNAGDSAFASVLSVDVVPHAVPEPFHDRPPRSWFCRNWVVAMMVAEVFEAGYDLVSKNTPFPVIKHPGIGG